MVPLMMMKSSSSLTGGGPHSTMATYTAGKESPVRESSWSAFWLEQPSILRECVREEDAGGRETGAHSATTPTSTARKDSPAREPSWSAFWLEKPSILLVVVDVFYLFLQKQKIGAKLHIYL